jgi:integrase
LGGKWGESDWPLGGKLSDRKGKAGAGSAVVRAKKGRLVIVVRYLVALGGDGRRYEIATGLSAEDERNLPIAQRKALDIEDDLRHGRFDASLERYRSGRRAEGLTIVGLLEQFTEAKTPHVYRKTLVKYRGLAGSAREVFGDRKLAQATTERDAVRFRAAMSDRWAPLTVRDKLGLMVAAWDWAIEQRLVSGTNPWAQTSASHKVPPKQRPKTFSKEELRAIVQGFRTHPEYSYYTDFVDFFLSSGCRTGEVAALRWEHVIDLDSDNAAVWIGESVTSDGDRKATKTNRDRTFPLGKHLTKLLRDRRPTHPDPKAAVFPSRRGATISSRNFADGPWRSVLADLGIDYQRPYKLRHSNATISLEAGQAPVQVASRLGHSPRTMFESYTGGSASAPPDILD